jgi:hypothetical protein
MSELNPIIKMIITDELTISYSLYYNDYSSFNKDLKMWLKANENGSTPLYNIEIEFLG